MLYRSILCGFAMLAWGCAPSVPDAERGYEEPSSSSTLRTASPPTVVVPMQNRPVTAVSMTYQNEASTLKMTLDPYDENLHVVMKRSQRPIPAASLVPSAVSTAPAKTDTVYIVQQTPSSSSAALPLTETLASVSSSSASAEPELQWASINDEVLSDIRRAQEYFYRRDYASAMRLVRAAQEKRKTAEGFALQGSIHYMLGDKGAARFYWTEALGLNPDMPEVVDALSKLDKGGR